MRSNTKGFTLVELMIVVAIIGILAAIAIPNFLKYQTKAKQSEAKVNLKGVYTAQLSYFAENDGYDVFSAISYEPESGARYGYDDGGTAGVIGNTGADACASGIGAVATGAFSADACANIDGDADVDHWAINDANDLRAILNDV
tara:strand:+ start:3028 stop:3459 length:432 start_codon:yes stop_codon:yes gene_type:complete